jgi:hypothetical protein
MLTAQTPFCAGSLCWTTSWRSTPLHRYSYCRCCNWQRFHPGLSATKSLPCCLQAARRRCRPTTLPPSLLRYQIRARMFTIVQWKANSGKLWHGSCSWCAGRAGFCPALLAKKRNGAMAMAMATVRVRNPGRWSGAFIRRGWRRLALRSR